MFEKISRCIFNIHKNNKLAKQEKFDEELNINARRVILECLEKESKEIADGISDGKKFIMNEKEAMTVSKELDCKVTMDCMVGKFVQYVNGKYILFSVKGVEQYQTNWTMDNYAKDWYICD